MDELWIAYAAACLAARGVRVDNTWTVDEIRAAWAAMRHPVEFREWVQRMSALAKTSEEELPDAAHAGMSEEQQRQWNDRADRNLRLTREPGKPEAKSAQPAELSCFDAITVEGVDGKAIFDAWADAAKKNAYVLVAGAQGYQRRLVQADSIRRAS
jgi:hypothetical protein